MTKHERDVRATFSQINPETGLLGCLEQLVPLLVGVVAEAEERGRVAEREWCARWLERAADNNEHTTHARMVLRGASVMIRAGAPEKGGANG